MGFRLILVVGLLASFQACGPPYEVIKEDFRSLRDHRSTKKYTDRWHKIKKARQNEQYKKAIRITQRLFRKANRQNNPQQEVKALRISHELRREIPSLEPDFVFKNLKKLAKSDDFLSRSLGYAMLAERYDEAYQMVPSLMIDSNKNGPLFDNPLITSWTRYKFRKAIHKAWEKALKPRDKLSQLYAGVFDEVIKGDSTLRDYRPSLFDLLAYKAVDYYQNGDGAYYTKAVNFQKGLFSLPQNFQRKNFNKLGGDSAYAHCIKLYRDITSVHLKDSTYSALIHTTLERLRFAYKHVALPKEKRAKLYYQGLDSVIRHYPESPVKAMAVFRKAQLLKQGVEPPESNLFSLKRLAVSICEEAIEKYPNSAGAQRCNKLLGYIQKPDLNLKVQKRYLPYQSGRMRLEYQNMDSLFYEFIPVPATLRPHLSSLNPEALIQRLRKIPSAYQLKARLPLYTIYEPTSKDIGIPALEAGTYAIVASNNPVFSLEKGLVDVRFFQVSAMAASPTFKDSKKAVTFRLVKAKHGKAVSNALVKSYKTKRNNRLRSLQKQFQPDSNGKIFINDHDHQPDFLACIKNKDTLLLPYASLTHPFPKQPLIANKTFQINKSVYKPGEQVIIKGSLKSHLYHLMGPDYFRSAQKLPAHLVGPSRDTLKSLSVDISASGLFHDSLKLPYLPGQYQLVTSFHKTNFSVKKEAASRFQLKLQQDSAYFPLNDTVVLQGSAKALSAVPIPSKKVSFKVWRTVRFPYTQKSDSLPPYATKLVKEGRAKTDSTGRFQLQFQTQIWPGMESYPDAVYYYKVVARMHQQQGPDPKASSTVKAADQQHYLQLNTPEWISKKQQQKPFIAESRTLNGTPAEKPLELRMLRLKPPPHLYRKQYWHPSQFQDPSAKAFHLKFPFDPYGEKPVSLSHQPIADTVWQGSIPPNKKWYLPDSLSDQMKTGTYRIKVVCKANDGYAHTTSTSHLNIYNSGSQKSALKVFQYIAPKFNPVKTDSQSKVFIGSAAKNTHLYGTISTKAGLQSDTLFRVSKGQIPLKLPFQLIKQQPVAITVTSVMRNRLYQDLALLSNHDQVITKARLHSGSNVLNNIREGSRMLAIPNFGAFGLADPIILKKQERQSYAHLAVEELELGAMKPSKPTP